LSLVSFISANYSLSFISNGKDTFFCFYRLFAFLRSVKNTFSSFLYYCLDTYPVIPRWTYTISFYRTTTESNCSVIRVMELSIVFYSKRLLVCNIHSPILQGNSRIIIVLFVRFPIYIYYRYIELLSLVNHLSGFLLFFLYFTIPNKIRNRKSKFKSKKFDGYHFEV